MQMVKKSITVTNKQEDWIKAQVISGDYGNDSEVIRDLIRQRQVYNTEIEFIRTALIEAEHYGFTEKTVKEIRLSAREKLRADGKL